MNTLYLSVCLVVMLAIKKSRTFTLLFLPWFLFGIIYTAMGFFPNYNVNPIDVEPIYQLEKEWFGISASSADLSAAAELCKGSAQAIFESGKLIPGEYFAVHHWGWADLLAGLFYLCWVPVPFLFTLYLYIKKEYGWMQRFAWCFLFVNLIGFVIYYIHPASPPWYAMNYGFDAVLGTPGNTAGLGRFDELLGIKVFGSIYGQNANVFAAVPSLHAAYMLIATVYAVFSSRRWYTCCLFAFICIGIWWTAVYTGHHYIVDVILGVITAIVGIIMFEGLYKLVKR